MARPGTDPFPEWFGELESRHLGRLKFAEVRRALQALSSLYVERRSSLTPGSALGSSGKRAAFALFYGPLHFLAVRHVVEQLNPPGPFPRKIIDLGCGTGAAGSAWAVALRRRPSVRGYDLHPWAVREAEWTYTRFGLDHQVSRREALKVPMPGRGEGLLAAWVVNELRDETRTALLPRLRDAAERGAEILIVSPIARGPAPWWKTWSAALMETGGRTDLWEIEPDMPETLGLLDRAAGLNHRRFRFRSISVNL